MPYERIVQERNSSNEVTAQLVRDGNIEGILSRTTAQGAAFYGYDGQGNVTLLTNSAGQDVAHYRYDAFGQTLEAVGPRAAENPYRFSTKELHAASGLYDFGLRFYSPGMGRWINRDPLQEEGGVNLYAMVDNSPINAVDEYGLDPYNNPCDIPTFEHLGSECSTGGPAPKPAPKPAPAPKPKVVNPVPGGAASWGPTNSKKPRLPTYPGHEGLDIFAKIGTPIVSATDGVVVKTGSSKGNRGGNRIWIKDSLGRFWYYAHMRDTPSLKVGTKVKAGQRIGRVGDTGSAKGIPHLHIGIARADPRRRGGVNTNGMNWKDWYYPYPILGGITR